MTDWTYIPKDIPVDGVDCYVRINYWFGPPFTAQFDSANQVWNDSDNNIQYPVWTVTRWRYVNPDAVSIMTSDEGFIMQEEDSDKIMIEQ